MNEQLYRIRLSKVLGLLVFAQTSSKTYTGTKEELEAVYKKVFIQNLILGWWSIFSIVWQPLALYRNYKNLQKLRSL